MTIAELDALDDLAAREALGRCCGSRRWLDRLVARRPFGSLAGLLAAHAQAAAALTRRDQLEAFAHHPRIGDLASLRERFASTAAWAGEEQRGAAAASDETLQAFADANAAYEARFGYRFIVFASGRGADELLRILEQRLGNDSAKEWAIAIAEQDRITQLRLRKLVGAAG